MVKIRQGSSGESRRRKRNCSTMLQICNIYGYRVSWGRDRGRVA
jgi:hypothetical protein